MSGLYNGQGMVHITNVIANAVKQSPELRLLFILAVQAICTISTADRIQCINVAIDRLPRRYRDSQ